MLSGQDACPVQVLVDDLRLLPQLFQLFLRCLVDLVILIRSLHVHLVIMIVPREEVGEHLRNTTLHLDRNF